MIRLLLFFCFFWCIGGVFLSAAAEGGTLRLQEGNLTLDGEVLGADYRAPSVSIRQSAPDEFVESSALYVGTHEAGGEFQMNRGLFAFELDPVRDLIRSGAGSVQSVSFVLTTASGNIEFPPGLSSFRAVRSIPFDPESATWNDPGPGHPVGGFVGEPLPGVTLDGALAGSPGEEIVFSGKEWTIAFRDAVNSKDELFVVLVQRASEDTSRMRGYFFRPADDSFRHSSGSLAWRPSLLVELE